MELNEILDGMTRDNCCNKGYGNSFDNCGTVGGNNNCAPFPNNCGGFGNNFGFGGGFNSLIWLFLLCGGFGGNSGFGNRCCCDEDCCCGNRNSGFGCNSIIWIIILSTLWGGSSNNCGNNNGNGFLGNCGC